MAKTAGIRLLAVDMDATCLNKKSQMTKETLQSLRMAADAGIIVVPTTGRSLSCLPHKLAERMDIYRYVISSNGASVSDRHARKELMQTLIPKEEALRLISACGGGRIGSTAHIRHEYYVEGRMLSFCGRMVFGKDAEKLKSVRNMEKIIQRSPYDVEEVQFYFLSPGAKKKIKKALLQFPDVSAAYTPIYVEVFAKQTSKGRALSFLAQHLNISREEIACIGDGENDLTMFDASGIKFAMGNAVPELRRKADYILPGNDKNGAAEGIRRILKMNQDVQKGKK